MDAVFALPEAPRAHFLRSLIQSFGATYVSLWQHHSHLSNRLFFLDGFYNGGNNRPTSSQTLFHQYRALTFDVSDECVPGVAFRNQLPYIHLKLSDLLPLTSTQIQARFFLEAGIQMAVFMGCKTGEIELGFSNIPQADIETALKNLFPEDFYIRSQSIDQNPYSSSFIKSSTTFNQSLNIPRTSHSNFGVAPTQSSPHLHTIQPFPTPEDEHEEIVRTLIQVMSSTSDQQHQPPPMLPHNSVTHPETADFVRYRSDSNIKPQMESNFNRQNLQNTSLLENLNTKRMRERDTVKATHPISSPQKYYHTISERKRREKLSECFQELSALLPPGTKKNKRSILAAAKETMISLMVEIEKLKVRNEQLMRVLSGKEVGSSREENSGGSCNERLKVRVLHSSESSSSEEQMVDLEVTMREQNCEVNVLIRIWEFLERVQNVTLISTNTNLHVTEGGTTINVLTFRLRIIEGSEWDEVGFEEGVRRVVADVTHQS